MKTEINVRGTDMVLQTHTRSLELCARMNYETENLDFIDQIPQGAVLFDLGACEGRFSIYAALKGINVYSFEPEANNYETLYANVTDNGLKDRLNIFNVGVGDSTKEAKLKIGQPWAGGHQKVVEHGEIREDLNFNFVAEQTIQICDLDSFILNKQLPYPEYIKIDIDGSEMPFLAGAKTALSKAKKIIFELDKNDKNYDTIIDQLQHLGFVSKEEFAVPNEPTLFNIIFEK